MHEDTVFARVSLLAAAGEGGRPSCTEALAKTRTGRSRLERRQGWQGAVMVKRDPPEIYTHN